MHGTGGSTGGMLRQPDDRRQLGPGEFARRRPRGLTLVEVLVVIVIIGLLMGILLPGIQAAREAVRMGACRNNLRQIGQAVQQFHSARGGFPPAVTGNHGLSFWAIILPYIDQMTVADRIDWNAGVCHDCFPGEPCWNNHPSSPASTCPGGVIDDASYAAGRANWVVLRTAQNLNYQICPTRGHRIVRAQPSFGAAGRFLANDYHMLKVGTSYPMHFAPLYGNYSSTTGPDVGIIAGNVSLFFNATTNRQVLQVAEVPPKDGLRNLNLIALPANNWNGQFNVNRGVTFPLMRPYADWLPRSRDADVLDGLSNTAIVAERHLPADSYGLCCDDVNKDSPGIVDTDAFPHWNGGNGPFGGYGGGAMAASVHDGIARGPRETFVRRGLGSWHPDYCNFLMADGAVKAIDITINSQMLVSLGDAKDGVEKGFLLVLP